MKRVKEFNYANIRVKGFKAILISILLITIVVLALNENLIKYDFSIYL